MPGTSSNFLEEALKHRSLKVKFSQCIWILDLFLQVPNQSIFVLKPNDHEFLEEPFLLYISFVDLFERLLSFKLLNL